MNLCNFEVSATVRVHDIRAFPAMSLRFLQVSFFMIVSTFCFQIVEALVGSNEPGPVQKTESETCTFAVIMRPTGSSRNR